MDLFAYLAPEAGGILLQALIGAVLGGLVIFRTYLARFVAKVKSLLTRPTPADDQEK